MTEANSTLAANIDAPIIGPPTPAEALGTGLLRGLLRGAGPPLSCFLLPRVHAADVLAAQPAQMPLPSSSSSGPVPVPSPSSLPKNIGKPEFPDTGWERIKELFDRETAPWSARWRAAGRSPRQAAVHPGHGARPPSGEQRVASADSYVTAPTGALVLGLQSLTGETTRQKRRREHRELYDLKLAEWTAHLQLTDELIGNLDASSRADELREDTRRVRELLDLPANEDATEDATEDSNEDATERSGGRREPASHRAAGVQLSDIKGGTGRVREDPPLPPRPPPPPPPPHRTSGIRRRRRASDGREATDSVTRGL
ncbi:uncharacterized protein [Embiotoca jacksoni]|uniref:uncharacterized protein n=1 Tax=Embiotoca jacksoni TaxID=100190 RepID=UPI003703C8BA